MNAHRRVLGRALQLFLFLGMMLGLALLRPAPVAHAATLTVNSLLDTTVNGDGNCTLRKAITNANNDAATYSDCVAGAGADTINFSVTGTILVGSTLPDIATGLTITGPGASSLTISGGTTHRVMSGWGIVNISDLTIANGGGASNGVGISFGPSGPLTLTRVTMNNNVGFSDGGAIYITSSATFNNCTFTNNGTTAGAGVAGGAIDFDDTSGGNTLTINNSTFTTNTGAAGAGGAIYQQGASGTLTIANSTFSGNSATGGGGIYNSGGTLSITNSTFSGNSATASGGGGITTNAAATITNSTFSGNSAPVGGGIYNSGGTLSITNSTFSGNSATTIGGGIRQFDGGGGTVTLRNTIVANSTASANCAGTITNGGNNLQFGGTVANSCGAGITTADPVLGALGNNGGPTQTMALLTGSAALDKIPNAGGCGFGITSDQRGVARPQPAGGLCDIGAYEYQAPAAPVYGSTPAPGSTIPVGTTTTGVAITTNLTVSNSGTAQLDVTAADITGANASDFSITAGGAPFSITSDGANKTVTIQCLSNTAGSKTATLTITHNAPGSPATYTLTCTVTAPVYGSTPAAGSTIPVGTTTTGTGITTNLTVSNSGTATLNVTAADITGANASDFSITAGGAPFSIASGGANQTITIRCLSNTAGSKTATLTITHNAPGSPATYPLTCTVNTPTLKLYLPLILK
jgi:hypothetical protein